MPDISKINALDIGIVSKVDGLAKASILDIDGVAVPSVPAPAAAYSVRLLGSGVGVPTYTGPAMRVRRDTAGGTGDDDEADIAFDSGVISLDSAISNTTSSASTLGQFLNVGTVGGTTYTNPDSLSGTASCFLNEWKDQSGNANHASQATFGSQPQIHSGTVDTDLITENGKPALDFDGSNDTLESASNAVSNSAMSAFIAHNMTATFVFGIPVDLLSSSTSNGFKYGRNGADRDQYADYVSGSINDLVTWQLSNNGQELHSLFVLSTGALLYVDAVAQNTTDTSGIVPTNTETLKIGSRAGTAAFFEGTMQEIIVYSNDETSNRTGIETNINGFFGIY